METQLEHRVKFFKLIEAVIYVLDMFKEYCEEKGTQRQLMVSHTPQQNGIAEYRNRTLLSMAR